MSSTDAILVLAAAVLGAAIIVAASLDSLRKSLVDSLDALLREFQWQQNGTGTKMLRKNEQTLQEEHALERELPNLAAVCLLPHQPIGKANLAAAETDAERERLAANGQERLAREERQLIRSSVSWRLGRWLGRLRG